MWSLLGPVFCLGLYLITGGSSQSPATHLVYLTLIGLSIAAGISLSTGIDPELIAMWPTAATFTVGPILAGLFMRTPND